MCLYPLIACQLQRIFIQLVRFITCLLLSLWCLEVVLPPHWYLAPQCYTSGKHLDFFCNIGDTTQTAVFAADLYCSGAAALSISMPW